MFLVWPAGRPVVVRYGDGGEDDLSVRLLVEVRGLLRFVSVHFLFQRRLCRSLVA